MTKLKVGDKVRLVYDARPLGRVILYGEGVITKITPTGILRIEGKTGELVRNELFNPYTGYAKGWNTLWFEIPEENP